MEMLFAGIEAQPIEAIVNQNIDMAKSFFQKMAGEPTVAVGENDVERIACGVIRYLHPLYHK